MTLEYKVIGRNIHSARQDNGMTQEAVAEAINVSVTHYGKVERGERHINLKRLVELCGLFGVPLESLLAGAMMPEDGEQMPTISNIDISIFMASIEPIVKGCSEKALKLMLRLCTDAAFSDKQQ